MTLFILTIRGGLIYNDLLVEEKDPYLSESLT